MLVFTDAEDDEDGVSNRSITARLDGEGDGCCLSRLTRSLEIRGPEFGATDVSPPNTCFL